MRIRWTTRIVLATGVLTLIAGVAAGGGPAHAAATGSASAAIASAATAATATAASAPGNAWAVGYTGTFGRTKTLIVHWNGKKWSLL